MRPAPRILLLLALAAACGGDDPKSNIAIKSSEGPRAADDLAITTHDGGVVLGVRHDTVRVRLSDSARASVKKEVSKETNDTGSGLGAFIAKKVGDAVVSTMSFEVSVPVSAIKSVTQQDSSIRFEMRDGSKGLVLGNSNKSKGTVGTFAPADADKFVKFVQPKLTP